MPTFLERVVDRVDNPGTPVLTTRTLDTTFQPSASRYTLCVYTIELQCTALQTMLVELRSDSAATPTVARCSAKLTVAATGVATTIRQTLTWITAPGDNVKLVTAGTGTAPVIAQQFEMQIS